MKNKKSIYTLLAILFAIMYYLYDNFDWGEKLVNINNSIEIDGSFDYLPTSTTGQVIIHDYYTLSYNEKYEQAEWVAYNLTSKHIQNTKFKRPFFSTDKKIKSKSAHYKDFKKSGYDKGHLCPAGDRKFSKAAHDETFIMSNVSPQKHDFNSGVWNRLEQKTRYWAKKYKGLYVITGGVLTKNLPTIGRNKVAVPTQFYKIVFDYTKPEVKAIAFLLKHEDSNKPLYSFVTSIDHIEKLTGIDFFPSLPDSIETKLEKSTQYKNWIFR
jgi:endonuclease G